MFFNICITVGWVLLLMVLLRWIKSIPNSACTGECNQGRNCTCKEKK